MHYLDLAKEISTEFDYEFESVITGIFSASSRRCWDPTQLTDQQAETIKFDVLALTETIDWVMGDTAAAEE